MGRKKIKTNEKRVPLGASLPTKKVNRIKKEAKDKDLSVGQHLESLLPKDYE